MPVPEPLPPPVPRPIPIMDPTRHSGEARNSRFIEPPMREHTPPDSLYHGGDGDDDDDDIRVRVEAVKARVFLGALNALLHMAACAVLLTIVGQFLKQYQGSWSRGIVYARSPCRRGGVHQVG